MSVVKTNYASISTTVNSVRNYARAVPLAEVNGQYLKSGSDHQQISIVHSSRTDILTRSMAVILLVIEK